jgi:ketosteroid isomerase-like protein
MKFFMTNHHGILVKAGCRQSQRKKNRYLQFGKYGGETNGTFKATLKTVAVCDDGRVVGVHHNSGERNGKKLDTACCVVFEIKDGQIYSGKEYFFDLNNWDEFWS